MCFWKIISFGFVTPIFLNVWPKHPVVGYFLAIAVLSILKVHVAFWMNHCDQWNIGTKDLVYFGSKAIVHDTSIDADQWNHEYVSFNRVIQQHNHYKAWGTVLCNVELAQLKGLLGVGMIHLFHSVLSQSLNVKNDSILIAVGTFSRRS